MYFAIDMNFKKRKSKTRLFEKEKRLTPGHVENSVIFPTVSPPLMQRGILKLCVVVENGPGHKNAGRQNYKFNLCKTFYLV